MTRDEQAREKRCGTCGWWTQGRYKIVGECQCEMEGTCGDKVCDIGLWKPKVTGKETTMPDDGMLSGEELAEALRYAGSEAPRKERQKRLGQIEAHIAAQTEQLAARPVLWECPDCGFAFDAGHEDEPDGGHSCPCCAERRLTEQLENAEAECARLNACPWCGQAMERIGVDGSQELGCTNEKCLSQGHGVWCYADHLRKQLKKANDTLARLHDYGIDTRNFGDGDAQALWGRIDEFRGPDPDDMSAILSLDDVRELAEWWAELHTIVSGLDEKLIAANETREKAEAERDAQEAEAERIRRLWTALMRAADEPQCHLRALEAINSMKAECDAQAKRVTALEKAARAVVEAAPGYTARRGSVWKLDYALDALRAVLDPAALDQKGDDDEHDDQAQAERIAATEKAVEVLREMERNRFAPIPWTKICEALTALDREGE